MVSSCYYQGLMVYTYGNHTSDYMPLHILTEIIQWWCSLWLNCHVVPQHREVMSAGHSRRACASQSTACPNMLQEFMLIPSKNGKVIKQVKCSGLLKLRDNKGCCWAHSQQLKHLGLLAMGN